MSPEETLRKIYFKSTDIDTIMHELVTSFERNLFPEGATPRPTADFFGQSGAATQTTSLGMPAVSNAFGVPPLLIPTGGDGANARHVYKRELVLVRDPEVGTKKILWWESADPRDIPHNHPWNFRSGIMRGGYTEDRYWLSNGVVKKESRTYTEGMINEVPADVFHNVRGVLPGTVTYLDCGPQGSDWGYLDGDGQYLTNKLVAPANFGEIFLDFNSHLKKK